ncbi:myosin-9 [Drosophila bipectinata]|uniref:myosin-9 n=1 Tax=Drosophila bipectinata TaxID=42026 RepID=UPI001C8A4307|nr:golgin subfamily A member 4 [Drosophila bipectinata]
MNTPGMSLFQGADTLNVNSTLDRQEEEEALQDQKRREEELGNLLENAFDDLDDEENTIDSTTNFQSESTPSEPFLPTHPPHPYPLQENHQHAGEINRLKMILQSKTNELENVNQIATAAHKQLDECQKRLTITQAELERALREKQNTHELLVETKERCSNQDNGLEKLRAEKKLLEEENTRLVGQLEVTRTLLSDIQCKYDMVQKEFHKKEERSAEIRVKHLEDNHRAQCDLLQNQLTQMASQLDRKKSELEQMQSRYNALQSGHESMLLDKAAKINELNQALDVAQVRCRHSEDLEADNQRQKQCISDLNARIASLEQTINLLNDRVSETTAELDLMDSLLQQHQTDESPQARLSQVGASRLVGSTPLNPLDRVSHIKQELYRALANLKGKREEVRRLEKQLEERNHEIRHLHEQENQSLVQLATLKEDKTRLENRLKSLQEEMQELKCHPQLENQLSLLTEERDSLKDLNRKIEDQLVSAEKQLADLKEQHESLEEKHDELTQENRKLRNSTTADDLRLELERHKILLKDAQSEVERLKKLYADIATDKESLEYDLKKLRQSDTLMELQEQTQQLAAAQRNLKLVEMKSEELSKILEAEKLNHERELQALRQKHERQKREEAASKESSESCSKCIENMAEIAKAEIRILKLENVNSAQIKEIKNLELELEESKRMQAVMAEKIELSVKQEELIAELKEKANQFQAFVSQQAEMELQKLQKKACPSPKEDSPLGASPKDLSQERIKRIEQRVRDEMAKLFAAELKKFTTRLQLTEEKNQCLQREYQSVYSELQQRQTEVDLLKQTILAEREKIEEMLAAKEEKEKAMLHMCRQELQAKNHRIEELTRESDEHQASIESERKSMKVVMAHWEKQQESIEQVEKKWREQLETMRAAHEEAMRAAQHRYQSAKRTAQNYKLYAEDKEAHMKREYERIKREYEASLSKIERQVNQRIVHKSRDRHRDKENQPINSNTAVTTTSNGSGNTNSKGS